MRICAQLKGFWVAAEAVDSQPAGLAPVCLPPSSFGRLALGWK